MSDFAAHGLDSGDKKAPAHIKPGVKEPSEPTKEEELPEEPSERAKEEQPPEKKSEPTTEQQQPETPTKEKRQQPEVFGADEDEGTFKTPTYH